MNRTTPNEALFTEKYRIYGKTLYRLALVYLTNKMDCEDVLHDVFVKLLCKDIVFKDSEHEKRWLLRLTVNQCIDKLRSKKRESILPFDESLFPCDTREEHRLIEMILLLPDKIKAPLHLFYYEGYKVHEIAKILGTSVSAIKMRLKRGRDMLRIKLEDDGYER